MGIGESRMGRRESETETEREAGLKERIRTRRRF